MGTGPRRHGVGHWCIAILDGHRDAYREPQRVAVSSWLVSGEPAPSAFGVYQTVDAKGCTSRERSGSPLNAIRSKLRAVARCTHRDANQGS
jgi:hypothetical protein